MEMTETATQDIADAPLEMMAAMDHEQVLFCNDKPTGLQAIIAIHNTVLGPAMGGTRMWNYSSQTEALRDVLRLSRGMTFKAAISGLNIGGGKAVIIGDARKMKSEAFMRRFGRFIHDLGGKYWTAEDVNMTARDMEYIRMETPYVTGLPESMGGSGEPSEMTAYGVYMGMKASAAKVFGSDSLKGKRVLVQGVGGVGLNLLKLLTSEGADLFISDIFQDKIDQATSHGKVTVVPPAEVYGQEVDIYAPCALGGTLNEKNIPMLKCAIIAGAANNQLDDESVHAGQLQSRKILYAPDFLINAGGITNVYFEQQGNYNRASVKAQTERIYDVCLQVFEYAEKNNVTTHFAAMKLATDRINNMSKIKLTYKS